MHKKTRRKGRARGRERQEPSLFRTSAGRPPPIHAKREKSGRDGSRRGGTGRSGSGRGGFGRRLFGRGAGSRGGKTRWGHWLKRLAVWGGSAAIWAMVAFGGLIAWYAYDLPEVSDISQIARRPSITLMAADGTLLASYGEVYGARVEVANLPPHLPRAVLAVEDRRFYQHIGVDFRGLLRASWVNLRAGRIVQGGSTVTQQLAKNLFLTPERTLKRKVQELLLALWLERKFTKDQILGLYLNRVYLGAGTYGVDAAARRYFGKPATNVSLYEAAQLAGLLKAPTRYSPERHKNRADQRTALVLLAMVEAGFATEAEAEQARQEKTRGRAVADNQARYFADWVLSQIPGYIGSVGQDLTVITTLNPYHQGVAEEELAKLLDGEGEKRAVNQGAIVILSRDGAVRGMVGGRSYDASQFNRATQALRQPGSAFKPFVYLVALEDGMTVNDRILDGPVSVDGWSPKNYGGRYYGQVTLREAFARSLNSVAVRISEKVGRDRIAAAARRLGISSPLTARPSLTLGASEVTLLELTGAYATFAHQGLGVWPYGIDEIRGRDGGILYRRSGGGPGRVVAPDIVDQMTDLMTATVSWGSGKGANPGRPAAGKTGTSQESRDAWFVGFTGDLVTGVWLGNDDGAAMKRVTGGSLPAALWRRVVVRALEGVAPSPLPGGGDVIADATLPGGSGQGLISRIMRSLEQTLGPGNSNAVVRRRDQRNEP